ncbi:MAG TPA: cob(I)yrinic acid a,c-diamide adenosyltransferase [Fimbriimonadaceae bacterium]|nr:cob(I)yrinic acid a,c-diamide adenosyltransferase [Fimbriimonadaceae bacterium]HRJ32753.1 cob(I)yrinic acid a,c-diamide adenosyltransferase [Fimbriimonadaceae bacterium]
MRIYTKTGDKGETGLVGGSRVPKHDPRIECLGAVDEVNASLGVARLHSTGLALDDALAKVQNWLFDVGAEIATPTDSKYYQTSVHAEHMAYLEQSIDEMESRLAPLKNFILPGGSALSAHLHLARTVCRRAERVLSDSAEEIGLRDELRMFVNRLSDWLFVAAREANRLASVEDVKWSRDSDG